MSIGRGLVAAAVLAAISGCAVQPDWVAEELPTRAEFEAIAFLDASHGWAVGERPEHGPQRLLRFNPR